MESILQFIYLGEASLDQERMDEFLQAAKSLEIAELSTVASESSNSYLDDFHEIGEVVAAENEIKGELEEDMEPHKGRTIPKFTGKSAFKCQECGKTFARNSKLKRHVDATHGGMKHKCQQCPKEYNQIDNLKTHVKITHEGRRFPCNQCSATFVRKRDLDSHIRKHKISIEMKL